MYKAPLGKESRISIEQPICQKRLLSSLITFLPKIHMENLINIKDSP